MRVIVVGGGIVGLVTARECLLRGADVVVIDQADLPNAQSTSWDEHRIVRALHRDSVATTWAAARAHSRWMALERELGARFYQRIGVLTALPVQAVQPTQANLMQAGVATRSFRPDELGKRWGAVRFPDGMGAILEPHAGVVLADLALGALVRWLRAHRRCELLTRRRAVLIDAGARAAHLADGDVVSGDRLVIAAGPWSRELIPAELAATLTLRRQTMLYCAVPAQFRKGFANLPAIAAFGAGEHSWLVPPTAGTHLKLSAEGTCRVEHDMTDRAVAPHWQDHLLAHFSEFVTGLDPSWVLAARDCSYLGEAQTGEPVLAQLGDAGAWAYAACGGNSFKLAPIIGRSLAERLTDCAVSSTGLGPLDRPVRLPVPILEINHGR